MLESQLNKDPNSMFKSTLPIVKKSFLARFWQYLCSSNEQRFSNEIISEKNIEKEGSINIEKDKEIAYYIEAEMFSMVLDIINNGYVLNKNLQKQFDKKVAALFKDDFKELKELHDKNYIMTSEVLKLGVHKLFINESYFFEEDRYEEEEEINQARYKDISQFLCGNYYHLINTKDFANFLIKTLKKQAEIANNKDDYFSDTRNFPIFYYEGIKEIFYPVIKSNIDFKQYLDCALEVKKLSRLVYEEMKKDIVENQEHINDIVESFKEVSLHTKIKQKVVSNAVKEANKFNTKNLPEESQKIIQEIENKLNLCIQSKAQINELNWDTINRLVEDKLPIIIKKFLNLDEEDLATLKNVQGQTPYEILNASLNNILNVMNDTVKELKQQNVNDLSVLHRYTEEVAKDYS